MGRVAPALPAGIHARVVGIIVVRRQERFILGTKAPGLAAAPIRVPSTLKCSSDSKLSASAPHTTSSTRARPASCASSHYRLLAHGAGANMTSGWRRAMTCAFMPYGSTFNGIQNVLSDEQVAAYAIGDELNDDRQNPVVYHRNEALITV
ncbi:MAG: hypothetical protein F4Y08_16355 [Caldilineaceae bacterium SB0662_bin_9]|uniref:Uncharacterized protein n=1 Tax=Caldilineaceae bacterium SB0662_bin_9 TaxID=2605258 RepID=A0A6B1DXV4_9CHLR|nr:hypothetical protein [Caldilineaceae bacterium SB0661_bin_34]MYD91876.1 hypothetical protein [Caldilineaceae bacterium SB0662_bin_9]